ncbi:corrinoid protein [Candidatus Formimonas warabiya]|uniref:Cobalamin-binding protein n=1 Tax=Formimonas warabiya TaxID=1761012 RepID=A0A3G1KZ54_FORW1|nr:corrinoid protein [Candidatus Formimonas warabiya]ATW27796.1 cobalamin-binding protein [Candidatus Formimonas warabiya]
MGDFSKEKLLQDLSDAVVNMEEEKVVTAARRYAENNFDAYEGIDLGLACGMNRASKLYEEEEYFVSELLLCSDAMYAGLDVLRPYLKRKNDPAKHKAVIGVVQGDTHDIGKNLVKIMLETAGFDVVDLGRDVPPLDFVNKAKEIGADLIALSTLMTTTMDGMKEVIEILVEENLRDRFKVIVGGGPISRNFAQLIGADGYAPNSAEAVVLAKALVS